MLILNSNPFSAKRKNLTIGLTGPHKLRAVDAHGLASEFGMFFG